MTAAAPAIEEAHLGDISAAARAAASRKTSPETCVTIARSADLPEAAFQALAVSPYYIVRDALAWNLRLPGTVLRTLANDPALTAATLANIAKHRNLPADIVTALAGHENVYVRRAVAGRKDVTDDQLILIQLAGGTDVPTPLPGRR
jgi:hypothetical protein